MADESATFPDLAEAARAHERAGDWANALQVWSAASARYPDQVLGHAGVAVALQGLKRFDEAEDLIRPLMERSPGEPLLAVEFARIAHRSANWPEALRRWQDVATRFPENADAAAGVGTALQMEGLLDQADTWLADACERFPNGQGVAVEYARVAHRKSDWNEALSRWQSVMARFPQGADSYAGAAVALERLGRHDERETLLADAVSRFPSHMTLAIDFARSADHHADPAEAVKRWTRLSEKFPGIRAISDGLGSALTRQKLHRLDHSGPVRNGSDASAGDAPPPDPTTPRDLMMQFEGLGSGCEFGLVQRHFGAEPLGVLRWGAIPALKLADALDKRFEGLGDVADVELFEFLNSGEYFFRDRKYSLEMHTFVKVTKENYESTFKQQTRRAKFLAQKILDDLDSPSAESKIFVYKRHVGSLDNLEIDAIFRSLRAYGDHTLLCVRPADAENASGSLTVAREGLMIGYVEGLSPTNNAKELNYAGWLEVCTKAFDAHRSQRFKNTPASTLIESAMTA
jgi:tetratricopeptide (TPR) repeat protein